MTAPATPGTTRPSFGVWQRLLRGYGPLAVFLVAVVLISILVPSKVPDASEVSTENASNSGDVGSGVSPGDAPADGATTGGGTSTSGGGGGGATATTGGGGGAGGGAGGDTPVTGATVGCPDREDQVPGDPYSPPCIAWSGENGGATSQGVTGDTITVAFRVLNERGFQQTLAELAGATLVDSPETVQRTVSAFADYFNQNFQFYGRQIEIAFYNGQGSNTTELLGGGRDKAEADAVRVAEEIGAFADLSGTSEPYADALARRGVIAFGTPYLSREWHEQRAPFAWSLATDGTIVSGMAAEYAVKRLYGKPAVHAGGNLAGKTRKFASLAPENSWYQESVNNARRIVTEAGFDPGLNVKYELDLGQMSNQATNIIAKLKEGGVTTVLCGCDPILPVFLSGVANRERYYPEFIIVGTALTDTDIVGQLWHEEFAKHAFGVSPLDQFKPSTETVAYAAYKAIRDDEPAFSVDLIYYQFYILAIGIHMAGPELTPQTFDAGMDAYPPHRGEMGLWMFGPGDRTATNDVREIYWDPNAVSAYNGKQGAYVGTSDQRWQQGEIPAGDPPIPVR